MRTKSLATLVALTICSISVAGQIPTRQGSPTPAPFPPRDTPNREPTGTARIRGRVFAADTASPLRGALVQLSSTDPQVRQATNTDAEGRYELAALPAARYTLTVTKSGYVSLQFGQQRPFEEGKALELADGQLIDRIDFGLPRGGVITGRIVDTFGDPIAGIRVEARRFQYLPGGRRQLMRQPGFYMPIGTDDRGHYRIYGLMPGAYVVTAAPGASGMTIMPTAGGGMTSVSPNQGYATTYYPGTAAPDEAQTIVVTLGQEASADFGLVGVKVARVSGIVRDSQGRPLAGGQVMLRPSRLTPGEQPSFAPTGNTGDFSIANVPPGEYTLDVRPIGRGPASDSSDVEFASFPITVGGYDIANLVVTTGPGATVSGRVIFQGAAPPPSSPAQPLRVIASPADPGGSFMFGPGHPDNGLVDANGTFRLTGIFGKVLFRVAPIPSGWVQSHVVLDGRDVTDVGTDLASGDLVSNVEVLLTDRLSTMSGTVRNARGEVLKDYVVVILPRQLREDLNQNRFVATTRPDQQGRYQLRGRPPGEYVAIAVESLEQGGMWDPVFQQHVRANGKPFQLREGESLMLDLLVTQP